jgi:hypothetical protein
VDQKKWHTRSQPVIRILDADSLTFISFLLQNAAAAQTPSVTLQSNGPTAISSACDSVAEVVNDVGLLAPLLVATELLELSIMSRQTTASAGAQNTIKGTLTAASTLYSGCHMTVPHDGPNVRSGRLVGFS